MAIEIDASDFKKGIGRLLNKLDTVKVKALTEVGLELLRLSTFEVPHDTGLLQSSGSVSSELGKSDEVVVGYNKVYAARLHENPQFNFQKGRKGKYLEDPAKNNLTTFREFFRAALSKEF